MSANNEERNLKILKTVVHGMGVLLIIGTIALVIAAFFKAQARKGSYDKTAAKETVNCAYKDGEIEMGGNIISATTNNNVLTITTSKSVVVYDLCKGEVLARVVTK